MTESTTLQAVPKTEDGEKEALIREAYLRLAREIRGPHVKPKRARGHLRAV